MTPFTITIEITEATQCHAAVSQLLRIFPSLRLTIESNERITTPSGTPQTALDAYLDSAYIARAIDAIRYIGASYRAAEARRVGTDEARQAAELAAKSRAEADAIHSQNLIDCEAAALDRRDGNSDPCS